MVNVTFQNLPEVIATLQEKVETLSAKVDKLQRPVFEKPMDVDEAADYLRKARQTLYNLCVQRKIPHIKSGKKLLFFRADLDKYLRKDQRIVREGTI